MSTKNIVRRALVLIALAVIGFAGWRIGSHLGRASSRGMTPAKRDAPAGESSSSKAESAKQAKPIRDFAKEWDAALAAENARERNRQIYLLCQEWVKSDPQAALAKTLETVKQRGRESPDTVSNSALMGLFTEWARSHGWAAAFAGAQGLADAEFRNQALRQIASEAPANAEQTLGNLAQLLTIPDADARNASLDIALRMWSNQGAAQGDAAMAWLDKLPADSLNAAERSRLELAAASGMLTRDPRGGAEWILAKTPPAQRGQQLMQIVGMWAATAPNACGEWLNTKLNGAETDSAVEQFVHQAARHDPESAYHWAAKITDPKIRERTTAWALDRWKLTDPDAARRVSEPAPMGNE